jgi:hypothetical protein
VITAQQVVHPSQAAGGSTHYDLDVSLTGRSKTIIVEPVQKPEPAPVPEPAQR